MSAFASRYSCKLQLELTLHQCTRDNNKNTEFLLKTVTETKHKIKSFKYNSDQNISVFNTVYERN